MPLYDFVCRECGHEVKDLWMKIAEVDYPQHCPGCGGKMEQSYKSSAPPRPFVPYVDEYITDHPVLIESHAQRRAIMKEKGLDFHGRRVGSPGCEI